MNPLATPTSLRERAEALRTARRGLLAAVFALTALGVVLVYSASSVKAQAISWEYHFLEKQLTWLGLAAVSLAVTSAIPYRWIRWLWPVILLGCLGLLAAVRVPGIGTQVNGAYRWLRFGGFSLQPSEVAKLGMVLTIAALLARVRPVRPDKATGTETERGDAEGAGVACDALDAGDAGGPGAGASVPVAPPFWTGVLPALLVVLATAALVAIEPDIGTACLLTAVLGATIFASGARLGPFAVVSLLALGGAGGVGWWQRERVLERLAYIQQRVLAWSEGAGDGAGWQIRQSLHALGSGGLTGVGVGDGPAKLYYLPEAHTDFIFALAGQEMGLLGTLGIVSLFAILLWHGFRLARHAVDRFGALVAFGVTFCFALQAAFNLCVVTALVPPKGISLPFVSFGGSGLCIAMASVGVLSSIAGRGARSLERMAEEIEDGAAAEGGGEAEGPREEVLAVDAERYGHAFDGIDGINGADPRGRRLHPASALPGGREAA